MALTSFNTTTANSTPQVTPATGPQIVSQDQMMGSLQGKTITTPQVSTPNLAGTVPFPAPVASPMTQYSPETGVSSQRVADATYNNAITRAVAGSSSVPSTATSGSMTPATAGAQRTTTEALLQQYLDQQKAYEAQRLAASTPSSDLLASRDAYKQMKIQAGLNQERALGSGSTSSFAGAEAQRVGRTDNIKLAALAADLQLQENDRANAVKTINDLVESGDKSFAVQLKIQELQSQVSGIDKQTQDTYFNIAQSEGIDLPYDPTKTATENLSALQKARATTKSTNKFGTPQQLVDNERSLLTSFRAEPQVKNYAEILTKANAVSSILDKKLGGPGDLAIVYEFMKGLDPTSVVRETEYATAAKSGNIFAGIYTKFNGYLKPEGGFLPENVKQSFESIVNTKLQQQQSIYDQIKGDYQSIAERSGLNPENVVINYDKTKRYTSSNYDEVKAMQQATSIINPKTNKPFTTEEIDAYKKANNILTNVGSDTNPATEQNLMGGLGNMQGLMGQLPPLEYNSTDFGNMSGLMKPSSIPVLQKLSIEIPRTSRLSFVNNNPGNLKFAGQDGAVKGEGGFAKFTSPQAGLNALVNQIKLEVKRGHTLASFVNKFAPPSENDTKQYIQQATMALGFNANTPLKNIPIDELAKFVAQKESSTKIN